MFCHGGIPSGFEAESAVAIYVDGKLHINDQQGVLFDF